MDVMDQSWAFDLACLEVALHGFENVLASAQQPDFVPFSAAKSE